MLAKNASIYTDAQHRLCIASIAATVPLFMAGLLSTWPAGIHLNLASLSTVFVHY